MAAVIKVLVVDDHAIVRDGLRSLIELDSDFRVVDAVASGMACLRSLARQVPHVILMDLKMPGIDGIETTRRVKAEHPEVKIILLTNYDDDEYVLKAIDAGADGYVLKNIKKGNLMKIIHVILRGQPYIDPAITSKFNAPDPMDY
jgi:DNA-binding NarL/FixJ family response regulator